MAGIRIAALLVFHLVSSFVSPSYAGYAGEQTDLEKKFLDMYSSTDFKTRVTAYVLTGDVSSDLLKERLRKIVIQKTGVERTAILYALNWRSSNEDEQMAFIESVPTDHKGIKQLLEVDSGAKSYLKGPVYLFIIDLLGSYAGRHDIALEKLLRIYDQSDGWMAENVSSMIQGAVDVRVEIESNRLRREKGK